MSVIVCVLLFIFFFKQKTAYEMRISDWSSDVCSSDLSELRGSRQSYGEGLFTTQCPSSTEITPMSRTADRQRIPGTVVFDGGQARIGYAQIGRASCRERVCQYV